MSDQDTTQDAPETTEVDEQQDTTQDDATDSPEETDKDDAWDPERAKKKISKVNSENRALRERATKAEEKAASAEDLKQQNTTLGSENLRLRVGYELGLPMSLALRLQGSTREEMLEDAQQLVELVAPTKRPTTQKPTEALRGGLAPDSEPEETDVRKLGERMFSR